MQGCSSVCTGCDMHTGAIKISSTTTNLDNMSENDILTKPIPNQNPSQIFLQEYII